MNIGRRRLYPWSLQSVRSEEQIFKISVGYSYILLYFRDAIRMILREDAPDESEFNKEE